MKKNDREQKRPRWVWIWSSRTPEWMTREPLPPHNVVFDVPPEEMDKVFEW
jgi:hypothetical protein